MKKKAAGLVENIVALDGIAIVTDKANTASNLTTQQLKDIYTGKLKHGVKLVELIKISLLLDVKVVQEQEMLLKKS